jgi:hypothetical protein
MGQPPDDSKSRLGSTAATKMGVSPEPFQPSKGAARSGIGIGTNAATKGLIPIDGGAPGSKGAAKGLVPSVQKGSTR